MKPAALSSSDNIRFTSPIRLRGGNAIDVASKASDKPDAAEPNDRTAQPLQRGLRNWDQQLNADLSNAQRALSFLDQSAAFLQSLKLDLSARLAGQSQQPDALEQKIRQFEKLWQKQQADTGGHLDSQLAYDAGPVRQEFTIRGLNMQSLRNGAKETLTFHLGAGQPLRSVIIEPGMSDDAIVQRLDEALAPSQIRVVKNANDSIVFSAAASSWGDLRETIAIKGDGIRFPTGQFNKVRTEVEQPAVQPESWKAVDVESIRRTLQQVAQALNQIRHAREVVSRMLREAMSRVQAAQPAEIDGAIGTIAQDFVAKAEQPDFQVFSSMMAAVLGVSRSRVLSLLSLRA